MVQKIYNGPRLYLDHNMSGLLATELRKRGLDAITAKQAGRMAASDAEHAAYAIDKDRVLVTHDQEFSTTASRQPIGQHIWVKGTRREHTEILMAHLDDVVELLRSGKDMVIRVGRDAGAQPIFGSEWNTTSHP